MNLILSTTFLSLTHAQREALIDDEDGITFYYPDQEERIMSDEDWRQDVAQTLVKVEKIKKMV